MPSTLHLLCGLAFSGKTTLARALLEREDLACVSLDDIGRERGLWGRDGIPARLTWSGAQGFDVEVRS